MSALRPLSKRVMRLFERLADEVRAATAVEYGLIVTLVVIACIAALIQVAGTTGDIWNDVSNKVTAAR